MKIQIRPPLQSHAQRVLKRQSLDAKAISLGTRLNRIRTSCTAFWLASDDTSSCTPADQFRDQPFTSRLELHQSQHQKKLRKCARRDARARQSVLPWRDILPLSPLRILRSVSTSLKLNCPSAPPVSDWSTCIAPANAFTSSTKPFTGTSCSETTWKHCVCWQLGTPPKLTNSSQPPRDRLSHHPKNVVNSATSAFDFKALFCSANWSSRDCWRIEKL